MSSYCSGCGSAETALEFLLVATASIGMSMSLSVASMCALPSDCTTYLANCFLAWAPTEDVDRRCQQVLALKSRAAGLGLAHVFVDLFDLLRHGSTLQTAACCVHGIRCEPVRSDVDVTGTPCQDFAPNGNRMGVNGPQWPVFLAWVTLILLLELPVVVHENVPQFDIEVLTMLMQHKYLIFSFMVDCCSVGFGLISRKRRYTVMYHRVKTRLVCSPVWLHGQLAQAMAWDMTRTACRIADCFQADANEVACEIAESCYAKGISVQHAMRDMTVLLTPGEQGRLSVYMRGWMQRVGISAVHCSWAVFNLGDNPGAGFWSWSAASGRIPGLRTHNAKLWVPFLGRWLTNRELLACMGAPVYRHLAHAAGVPQVHVCAGADARHMLGNMMHVASVGSVIAAALASCQLVL